MVSGFEIFANLRASRLVHLARWQERRPTTKQLVIHFWTVSMEVRSDYPAVLLPLFLSGTAGLELAKSRRGKSHVRYHALLVPARRFRFPLGRCGYAVRRSGAERQSAGTWNRQIRPTE